MGAQELWGSAQKCLSVSHSGQAEVPVRSPQAGQEGATALPWQYLWGSPHGVLLETSAGGRICSEWIKLGSLPLFISYSLAESQSAFCRASLKKLLVPAPSAASETLLYNTNLGGGRGTELTSSQDLEEMTSFWFTVSNQFGASRM